MRITAFTLCNTYNYYAYTRYYVMCVTHVTYTKDSLGKLYSM